MSDFIMWNLIFAIGWAVWKCLGYLLPKHVTFAILNVSTSAVHGNIGTVLVNDQKFNVIRRGVIWRYAKDAKVLPEEWAEKLDQEMAKRG